MDTRFLLDQRTGKTGRGIPLKIVLAHKAKAAMLNTGIRVMDPEQWNEANQACRESS